MKIYESYWTNLFSLPFPSLSPVHSRSRPPPSSLSSLSLVLLSSLLPPLPAARTLKGFAHATDSLGTLPFEGFIRRGLRGHTWSSHMDSKPFIIYAFVYVMMHFDCGSF